MLHYVAARRGRKVGATLLLACVLSAGVVFATVPSPARAAPAALSAPPASSAHTVVQPMATKVPAALAPLSLARVADGVYAHEGRQEQTSAANHGDIANLGVVVGQRCVAVIDTGGSAEEGAAFLAAIRKITPRPVCYVINTHMHPDHVFGNAAFKPEHPQFVGNAALGPALDARREVYMRALERELDGEAAGSELISPTLTVKDRLSLDLGGRTLTLRTWKTAHTNNDLSVFDEQTGTLFTGDLLFVKRTPALDGSITGWLADLRELRTVPARHVVPGHGPVDPPWPAALDDEAHYLDAIVTGVRAALKAGKTIQEAVNTVGATERSKWLLFDDYHHRNVTAAYSELEWE